MELQERYSQPNKEPFNQASMEESLIDALFIINCTMLNSLHWSLQYSLLISSWKRRCKPGPSRCAADQWSHLSTCFPHFRHSPRNKKTPWNANKRINFSCQCRATHFYKTISRLQPSISSSNTVRMHGAHVRVTCRTLQTESQSAVPSSV